MPAASRIGDMTTGHTEGDCFFPPKPAVQGSSNVFVNGKALVGVGDLFETHCCGDSCHDSVAANGSSNVFVNGKAVARIGDSVSCNNDDLIAQGSSNVFVN